MVLRRLLSMMVTLLLVGSGSIFSARAGDPATDLPQASSGSLNDQGNQADLDKASRSGTPVTVIVEFDGASTARQFPGLVRRNPNEQGEIQNYDRQLNNRQDQFEGSLRNAIPAAKVNFRYRTVLNGMAITLPGWDIPVLRRLPGVRSVALNRERIRQLLSVSVPLTGAPSLWTDLPTGKAGEGIKIGIIDGGIDIRNPMFAAAVYTAPTGFPKVGSTGPSCGYVTSPSHSVFVNNKVIVALGYLSSAPTCDLAKPTDSGHGSHVAGTAAGNAGTITTYRGVQFTLGGVAPRAYLGNYNVFPNGAQFTGDQQIIAAIQDAVRDGMDVINMSIGGPPTVCSAPLVRGCDPEVDATNDAVAGGVVVAVAAGNNGPDDSTVERPGVAENAITAGSSTNAHFVGQPVSVTAPPGPPPSLTNLGGAVGAFDPFTSTTTAKFVWWGAAIPTDEIACNSTNSAVAGKVALILRGTCTFSIKIRNAQTSGAIGAIIFNNVAGDPIAMAFDSTCVSPCTQPTIPAVMVSNADGVALRNWYTANGDPSTVRLDPSFAEFRTGNQDVIAGSSARGPVLYSAADPAIKPDVTAPGVNVLSAAPCLPPTCADPENPLRFSWFSGTSMATPHVAGAAALLRQLHPSWTPQDIKSALMSTASRPVRTDSVLVTPPPPSGAMTRGAGRIDLSGAKNPRATFTPASLSFGVFPLASLPATKAATVVVKGVDAITGPGGGTWTTSVSLTRSDGTPAPGDVTVTVSQSSVTVTAGPPTVTLTITVQVSMTATGIFEGDVILRGPTTLMIPFWLSAQGAAGGGDCIHDPILGDQGNC